MNLSLYQVWRIGNDNVLKMLRFDMLYHCPVVVGL